MSAAQGGWEAVIGIEVHVQLATESKIFCACPARPPRGTSVSEIGANTQTCPICAGHPGTLPVLNRRAVEYAVRAGLATGCEIRRENVFARKNYFYADLPRGYQISQLEKPICENGQLEITTSAGNKRVAIQRIHMEEDAGKSVHHAGYSLVNLNRAGVPLVEIVSGPDMRSPEEAGAYLRALYAIVTYLGICEGNLEEGNFRCDANVSVRPRGQEKFGTRCEIKNVNSFRFVEKAIEFEINRQTALLMGGGRVVQETRGYDSGRNSTFSMRSKEEAEDYRYFPDPDLIAVRVSDAWIEEIRSKLPELPAQRRARYVSELGLSDQDAELLTSDRAMADFFERALVEAGPRDRKVAKGIANLLAGEVTRLVNEQGWGESKLTPRHLAECARLLAEGVVSSTGGKQIVVSAWSSGESVDAIVEREGLKQVSDLSSLEPAIEKVLAASPAQVAEFRSGKEKVIGFLVGQVMKQTGGKANPSLVQDLIRKKIGELK